ESARVLSTSRRIILVGVGASGLAATDLQYKLTRLGLSAQALTSDHDALPAVTALDGRDCLLAISDSGRTTDVLDAVEIAVGAGARVIAITGSPVGPLARRSGAVLLTAARDPSFRAGPTASRLAPHRPADHRGLPADRARGQAARCRRGGARPHPGGARGPSLLNRARVGMRTMLDPTLA